MSECPLPNRALSYSAVAQSAICNKPLLLYFLDTELFCVCMIVCCFVCNQARGVLDTTVCSVNDHPLCRIYCEMKLVLSNADCVTYSHPVNVAISLRGSILMAVIALV